MSLQYPSEIHPELQSAVVTIVVVVLVDVVVIGVVVIVMVVDVEVLDVVVGVVVLPPPTIRETLYASIDTTCYY